MSNPFQDLFEFLQSSTLHGRFPIYISMGLLIASVVIAVFNFSAQPGTANKREGLHLAGTAVRRRYVVPADALEDAAIFY